MASTLKKVVEETDLIELKQVPGDVLLCKAGNKLPADVRFTQVSSDSKFDRSILTGKLSSLASQFIRHWLAHSIFFR